MTETQSTPNHRAPLAPGEIRTHQVGAQKFTVMHVAGGSYTQASVRESGRPSRVLHTGREDIAVSRYADAIAEAEEAVLEQAESEEGWDDRTVTLHPTHSTALRTQMAGRVLRAPAPDTMPTQPLQVDKAIAELKRFEEIDHAAVARGESPNWWERGIEPSTPAPTLADDVAALRQWIKSAGVTIAGSPKALAILDRIAARAPQRATDRRGDPLRMHMPCRQIVAESRSACRSCDEVGPWRALYVLPDGA
jgi:hypothetical protein